MVKYHELRAEKINLHAPEVQRIKLGDGKEKEKKKSLIKLTQERKITPFIWIWYYSWLQADTKSKHFQKSNSRGQILEETHEIIKGKLLHGFWIYFYLIS